MPQMQVFLEEKEDEKLMKFIEQFHKDTGTKLSKNDAIKKLINKLI